jgi:hypothetical protein
MGVWMEKSQLTETNIGNTDEKQSHEYAHHFLRCHGDCS